MSSVKEWTQHPDTVLSVLSKNIIERKLLKIELQDNKFDTLYINKIKHKSAKNYCIDSENCSHLVFTNQIDNKAYNTKK